MKRYIKQDCWGELPQKPVYALVKRCFDIILSAFLLLQLAIPMTVIGLTVKVTSPGPALYTQAQLVPRYRRAYSPAPEDTIVRNIEYISNPSVVLDVQLLINILVFILLGRF